MRKNRLIYRLISVVTLVLLTTSVISGCGALRKTIQETNTQQSQQASGSTKNQQSTVSDAPTPISFMVPITTAEAIDKNNIIWKEVEKRTNTVISVDWVPNSNFTEKVNVTIASGSMPDVIKIDPMTPNVMTAALNGAFWEVGKYINEKDYPELAKYEKDAWLNTKYKDGKNYGLPRPVSTLAIGNLLNLRTDWLEKLNMKVPETIDEVYNTLKAFVEKDPDGNGQKDTIGVAGFISPDGTNMGTFSGLMSTVFGSYLSGYFYEKDGTYQSALSTPEFKQSILWLRKLYSEGILYKDFVTLKQQQERDLCAGGKVGAFTEAVPGTWVVTSSLRKVEPKGTFVAVPYLVNSKGTKFYPKGGGYSGGFMINKKSVDEARLKKILKYFDMASTKDVWEVANYGYEGTHFKKDGNLYIQTEQAAKDKVGTVYMGLITVMIDKYIYAYNAAGIPADFAKNNMKLVDEMEKYGVSNPGQGLISDTWTQYSNEYNKKITDQILKIVLGTDSPDNWDTFAANMEKDSNYKKALTELQAAFKAKMGK